jgi:flagellar hook-basal body complex protein FliE
VNVDAVDFLPLSLESAQSAQTPSGAGADFARWLEQELGQVNDKLNQADDMVRKLALGEVDNVHQVMVALDQARISFQMLSQVRNKLLESYQDILRMTV